MLLDGLILKCNTSIQTNRTSAAIYNILRGAKAIQTVLDIHLYHLKNVFGIYPTLQKKDFDIHIERLRRSGHLLRVDENINNSTEKGKELLEKCKKTSSYHYFNGFQYIGVSGPFMERLLLTIQTFTNKQANNNHFIPVVDKPEIYQWVKQYYCIHKEKRTVILKGLYVELSRLLENMTKREASLFVDRLTGYDHYGDSIYQLHTKYELPIYDIPLILEGIIHQLLFKISQEKTEFPILNEFVAGLHRSSFLTDSATKTYQLYRQGLHTDEMASIRKLKVNTIHDHLVEIALYDPDFSYHSYVNQTEIQIILKAIQQTNSYKLKDIKAWIDAEVTYFQIRLVLAIMGNIQ